MRWVILLCGLFFSTLSLGQKETLRHDLGPWYMGLGIFRVHDNWSLHLEGHTWYYHAHDNYDKWAVRTGVNYHINKKSFVTGGYEYWELFTANTANEWSKFEHRPWQAFTHRHFVGRSKLEHRIRVEQRIITTAERQLYKNRFRYRLMVNYPLNDKQIQVGTLMLTLFGEGAYHMEEAPLSWWRFLGGFTFKATGNLQLQGAYVKEIFQYDLQLQRIRLAVIWTPDLRK